MEKYLPKLFKNDNPTLKQLEKIELSTITKTDLLRLANPEEKAVFLGLSQKLGLNQNIPDKEIKSLSEKLKKERDEIQKKKKIALDLKNKHRDSLRKKLLSQYPESSNPYHPTTVFILSTNQKNKVLEIVKKDQIWEKLMSEKSKVESFESERFTIEKREVKIMRLKKCMENIILAYKLSQLPSLDQNKRYNKLLELERTCLEQN
jgi:outer membrane phospholipase A